MSRLIQLDPDLLLNEDRRDELFALWQSLSTPQPQEYPSGPVQDYTILNISSPTLEELEKEWSDSPRFCITCLKVSRDLALFSKPRETTPSQSLDFIEWESRLAELAAAAERGCQFCSFMAVRFFNDAISSRSWGLGIEPNRLGHCCKLEIEPLEKVQAAIARVRSMAEKWDDPSFKWRIQPVDYHLGTQKYGKLMFDLVGSSVTKLDNERREASLNEILGTRRQITLEVFAVPGDASTNYLSFLPINTEPGSEESFGEVRGWIEECIDRHDECHKPTPGRLPTRLVEILDEDNLRIFEGISDPEGLYVALSYCWGGPQGFATTTDSLPAMKSGFKAADLPSTLQDAVKAVRGLNKKYLWIDSLCILQDSPADKLAEVPRMASYYADAYIVLTVGANSVQQSFLAPHGLCERHIESKIPRDLLEMRLLCPNGEPGMMLFREENPYRMSEEPIAKRGWTFQERVLSSRMVFYGQRRIWQCARKQLSAGGTEEWALDWRTIGNTKIQADLRVGAATASLPDPQDDSSGSVENTKMGKMVPHPALETWYAAVHEYSYRDLTFPQDKLPAISAVAASMSAITQTGPSDYAAGLWRSDLLRGLLWSTYPTMTLRNPTHWRAPSWSWASVDNVVSYARLRPAPSAIPVTTVLRVSAPPVSELAPFGEAASGAELVLRAPCLQGDRDFVQGLVRLENMIERGQDFSARGWEQTLDLMARGITKDAGAEGWVAPEGCVIAILFVTVKKGREMEGKKEESGGAGGEGTGMEPAEGATGQTKEETNGEDAAGGEESALKQDPKGVAKNTSLTAGDEASRDEGTAAQSVGTQDDGKADPEPDKTDKGEVKFTGLILGPVEDGKYERLGAFSFAFPGGTDIRVPREDLTIV